MQGRGTAGSNAWAEHRAQRRRAPYSSSKMRRWLWRAIHASLPVWTTRQLLALNKDILEIVGERRGIFMYRRIMGQKAAKEQQHVG